MLRIGGIFFVLFALTEGLVLSEQPTNKLTQQNIIITEFWLKLNALTETLLRGKKNTVNLMMPNVDNIPETLQRINKVYIKLKYPRGEENIINDIIQMIPQSDNLYNNFIECLSNNSTTNTTNCMHNIKLVEKSQIFSKINSRLALKLWEYHGEHLVYFIAKEAAVSIN